MRGGRWAYNPEMASAADRSSREAPASDPLVAEAIGRRFPYYHPGFFNGIFSLALVGGLIAPATLGYVATVLGVGVVIGIPLLGTFIVMLLILLIWLESKVTGR